MLTRNWQVRIQTSPVGTFPTTLREAFPKILKEEGVNGFYKVQST